MRAAQRLLTSLLALALTTGACDRPAPPAPTVATLTPSRAGVTLSRGGAAQPVPLRRRVEADAVVRVPAGVRAALSHDSGAFVLLDGGSAATITAAGLKLEEGRVWVDARHTDPLTLTVAGSPLTLTLQSAGVALQRAQNGALSVYCAAGQATWSGLGKGGRLESGLSLVLDPGQPPRETAQALWEDWTLGLAEPGPLRPLEAAGVGQLLARRPEESGSARTPVTVRQHEVRVAVHGDLATTTIDQVFFNGRPDTLDGVYAVRVPEGAILEDFAVGEEGSEPTSLAVRPRQRGGGTPADTQLEWAGPGRYRGLMRGLAPGKTRLVRLRYREWLPHVAHGGGARRSYVYPMGQTAAGAAGEVPNLGEFSLEVDLSGTRYAALEAGMGAQVEGRRVVLRRSDFRPRADFALDLIDEPARDAAQPAYRSAAHNGARYLLTQPVVGSAQQSGAPFIDAGAPPPRLDLVLVVDVSAATDLARLDLARAAARALLSQLRPDDRVAVVAASLTARPLGREALAPATPARVDELIDALGRERPAGATDLGLALRRATALLPPGQGTLIYLGDGRPTVGALLPGELRAQLQALGPRPRLFALAVGDADTDLLAGLCDGAGVLRIEDRPEAIRAALALLERAARPALTGVRVSLGEGADVVFPEDQITIEGGQPLTVTARLREGKSAPQALTVTGLRDGQPFTQVLPLRVIDSDDGGDLGRRWAQERLLRLLARGEGREAAVDIGGRFGLVTPWTALAPQSYDTYAHALGEDERGTFVPPALRGRAPEDTPVALEAGVSTTPVQALDVDALYTRLIEARKAGARLCYDRKAAGHPELSGRVQLQLKVGLDGAVIEVKQLVSTLRDPDVEGCMARALGALRLPPPPDGKVHQVALALQLEQEARDEGSGRCSAASRAYLGVRRALWRERLGGLRGAGAVMNVFRAARARCELRTWVDRRALIDLLRPQAGATADQVELYHLFAEDEDGAEAQDHLRREILRAVRTPDDVRAAQVGLNLAGAVDPQLLEQELAKARTPAAQIDVLRRFLALLPGSLSLKLRLLRLYDATGQKAEALRLGAELRADPGADAAVRQAVGELLLRHGDGAEGARAFSEIVEFAPFDPWGRRRLGDLYRAHRLYDAAYREYQVLGWLLPQDESVFLLLSGAALGAGRSDESLRLLGRVAEGIGSSRGGNGPAAQAQALQIVRLWQLIDDARRRGDKNLEGQLLARGRSDGIIGHAGQLFVALTYEHPDAALQLSVRLGAPQADQGDKAGKGDRRPAQRAALQGGSVGIEAQRFARLTPEELAGLEIQVSRPVATPVGAAFTGEVLLLSNEADAAQRLNRVPVRLDAEHPTIVVTVPK